MILESFVMTVNPGSEDDFAKGVQEARKGLEGAQGFHSIRIGQGIEVPNHFFMVIEWDTVADHKTFRRDPEAVKKWRGPIGEFIAEPPHVEHFTEI